MGRKIRESLLSCLMIKKKLRSEVTWAKVSNSIRRILQTITNNLPSEFRDWVTHKKRGKDAFWSWVWILFVSLWYSTPISMPFPQFSWSEYHQVHRLSLHSIKLILGLDTRQLISSAAQKLTSVRYLFLHSFSCIYLIRNTLFNFSTLWAASHGTKATNCKG